MKNNSARKTKTTGIRKTQKKRVENRISDIIALHGEPKDWKLKPLLEKFVHALRDLKHVPRSNAIVLSVSCVNSAEMTELNAEYRGKRRPTDVLSFEQKQDSDIRGMSFLGDLVLCIDVVRAQAKEQRHTVQDELAVLTAHGLLHLLGYDHERSEKDAKKMEEAEAALLKAAHQQLRQTTGLIQRSQVKKNA